MKRIVMYINDRYNTIENILNYIKELTKAGHGFDVEIDPDDKEYHKHFYIDGDGTDKIREIYVDDDKLRTIETDTAYECGKHANKWIPCSERLPKKGKDVLVTRHYLGEEDNNKSCYYTEVATRFGDDDNPDWISYSDGYKIHPENHIVIAWQYLPEAYMAESEE